jgi:23S rRNA pseudouridine2605 synthase
MSNPKKIIKKSESIDGGVRINKFIASTGYCSRRQADELILEGKVLLNKKVVKVLGTKILPNDEITINGQVLSAERKEYVLMNKPKNVICSKKDENNRQTVMDLLPTELQHLNPVGRLDRNTTGVLILTNDGEITHKLTHPSSNITKVYKATLDNPLNTSEFNQLLKGVELEDGISFFDQLAEIKTEDGSVYGIQIHSGKNRIVRRMFEYFGRVVEKLDRVMFHKIDKGGLKRGEWRFLRENEIRSLGVKELPKAKKSFKPNKVIYRKR